MKKVIILVFIVLFATPWVIGFAQTDSNNGNPIEINKTEPTKQSPSTEIHDNQVKFQKESIELVIRENLDFLKNGLPLIMIILAILISAFIVMVVRTTSPSFSEAELIIGNLITFAIIIIFLITAIITVESIGVDNKIICSGNIFQAVLTSFAAMLLYFIPSIIYLSEAKRGTLTTESKAYTSIIICAVFSILLCILSSLLVWTI